MRQRARFQSSSVPPTTKAVADSPVRRRQMTPSTGRGSATFSAPREMMRFTRYTQRLILHPLPMPGAFSGATGFSIASPKNWRVAHQETHQHTCITSHVASAPAPARVRAAVHAIDVPFLFETYDVFGHTPDADDAAVTDAMQNAWTGLAGDPTAAPPYLPSGASAWPAFDINDIQIVNVNAPMTIDTMHREGRCSLLRDIISL